MLIKAFWVSVPTPFSAHVACSDATTSGASPVFTSAAVAAVGIMRALQTTVISAANPSRDFARSIFNFPYLELASGVIMTRSTKLRKSPKARVDETQKREDYA
ncbi:hypothetical protein [Clavibacter michiganensis]|uniref:hypothetical protein n=1 Tax=Clavibacter michiganensis TaxID=28447 RepID=UPI0029317C8A|nr:hypothetical protein [Clavibacter michiganensis]